MESTIFRQAIVRRPGPNFAQGLTTVDRGVPDYELLLQQHDEYVAALEALGLTVTVLDPLSQLPDAYFVEDVAIMLPGFAVLTQPGTAARQPEIKAMYTVLANLGVVETIDPPGHLDGGDVMFVEEHCFIGLSTRTNRDGAEQLGRFLEAAGYSWSTVPVIAGLHLKTGVTYIGHQTLVMTDQFAAEPAFARLEKIVVPKEEAHAANTLLINDHVLVAAGYPHTKRALSAAGRSIITCPTSEISKMDGGLTCLSLRF